MRDTRRNLLRRGAKIAPVALLCFGLVLTLGAGALNAQTQLPPQDAPAWAYQLPHDLMSPFCPGRTLAACTSPQAAELRTRILLQAAAGASRADVEAQLAAEFGEVISPIPKAEGWGRTTFVVPLLGFVVGVVVVGVVLRRLVLANAAPEAVAEATPAPAVAVDEDALAAEVDREIALRI